MRVGGCRGGVRGGQGRLFAVARSGGDGGRPRAYQPDARRQGCFAPLRGGLRPSL